MSEQSTRPSSGRRNPLRWLLALPFIAVLWVPFYNSVEPSLGGVPFFYWYQLLWVLISSAIVYVVYVTDA
jgi:hypothetical protein